MCVIRLGGEKAEFLAITVLDRTHAGCTDYWDGNWLRTQVEVAAGGFTGFVTGQLRTDEIAQFHAELTGLQESLRGAAEFTTLEEWLSIRAHGDGRGHMSFDCVIRDVPGTGNTLRCTIELDQTFVRPLLAQLADALTRFSVIGNG